MALNDALPSTEVGRKPYEIRSGSGLAPCARGGFLPLPQRNGAR